MYRFLCGMVMRSFLTLLGIIFLLVGVGQGGFVISEISYDGLDEWIELVWMGDEPYSGSLTVLGAKSVPLDVQGYFTFGMPFILADAGGMIVNNSCIHAKDLGLSLVDTAALSVSILREGILDDIFEVSQKDIQLMDNKKTSFVRNFDERTIVPHSATMSSGGMAGWTISPCVLELPQGTSVLDESNLLVTDERLEITNHDNSGNSDEFDPFYSLYSQDTIDTTNYDYDVLTSSSNTHSFSCLELDEFSQGQCSSPQILITEISAQKDEFGSYLELYFGGVYSGTLALVGAGIGKATKYISVAVTTGQYMVIGEGDNNYFDKKISGFNLRNTGEEIILLGHCGQVLDSVFYSGSKVGTSQYFSSYSGTQRQFSGQGKPTPGALGFAQVSVSTSTPTSQLTSQPTSQGTNQPTLPSGLLSGQQQLPLEGQNPNNLPTLESTLQGDIQSFGKTTPLLPDVILYGFLPDPVGKDTGNEGIALFGIPGSTIQGVTVRMGKKSTLLEEVMLGEDGMVVVFGNFGLVNGGGCVDLVLGEHVLDTQCYPKGKEGVWHYVLSSQPAGLPQSQPTPLSQSQNSSLAKATTQLLSGTNSKNTLPGNVQNTSQLLALNQRLENRLGALEEKELKHKRVTTLQKHYINLLVDAMRGEKILDRSMLSDYERGYRLLYSSALQGEKFNYRGFTLDSTNISAFLALQKNQLPIRHEITIPYDTMTYQTEQILNYVRTIIGK